MAVDYRTAQLDTVSRIQTICASILDLIAEAKQVQQEAIDQGFAPGVAVTGITDALLNTVVNGNPAPFPDLVAADIAAAVAAINSLDTTLAASARTGYKAMARMR